MQPIFDSAIKRELCERLDADVADKMMRAVKEYYQRHEFDFSVEGGHWEKKAWMARTGIPLRTFRKRWDELANDNRERTAAGRWLKGMGRKVGAALASLCSLGCYRTS